MIGVQEGASTPTQSRISMHIASRTQQGRDGREKIALETESECDWEIKKKKAEKEENTHPLLASSQMRGNEIRDRTLIESIFF